MRAEASDAARRLRRAAGRGRRQFRRWRRGRPFWGGAFLILGGVQLFLSSQLSLIQGVEISFGPEGFLVVLLPAILLLCGILLWATPQYRFFYAIIGTITAIYSLLGLNLGGWFLGMLLGIVGGALGFGWTPVTPPPDPAAGPEPEPGPEPQAEADPDRPTMELPPQPPAGGEGTGPLTDETPGRDQTAPVRAPRPDPRTYSAAAIPLLLVAALAGPAVPATLLADHCLIPLPLLCSHESAASESTPSATPEPTLSGSPSPTATPEPPPSPTPTPDPDPDPEPGEPDATPSPTPTPTITPTPTPTPTPIPTIPPTPDQPLVSAHPARMTADRLTQQNFRFDGIAELPTADGTIEALQFSFSRSTATNFALAPSHDGQTTRITADPLVISGDVTFYTSRFTGRLFGALPLELTPDSPLVDLLELVDIPLPVLFTDVDLDLVFTHGAQLTATGFALSLPAP